jgi:hypothetical protein
LQDNKIALGKVGLELGDRLQRLDGDQVWQDVSWAEMIGVQPDDLFLLKLKGILVNM